jgi:translation initiation factor IF-3
MWRRWSRANSTVRRGKEWSDKHMAMRRRFSREPRGPQIRINHRIRVPEVRVVAEDGSNLGVLPTEEALRRARSLDLDLVEVNPKSSPPVCKILDFGKYKYEEKKRQREAKRRQTTVEVKEIKLRPKTDDHDLNVKVRAARKFFESGNKVKVICRFRGDHPPGARADAARLHQLPGGRPGKSGAAAHHGRAHDDHHSQPEASCYASDIAGEGSEDRGRRRRRG